MDDDKHWKKGMMKNTETIWIVTFFFWVHCYPNRDSQEQWDHESDGGALRAFGDDESDYVEAPVGGLEKSKTDTENSCRTPQLVPGNTEAHLSWYLDRNQETRKLHRYIHIHIHIQIRMYIYIYTFTYTYRYVCTYTYKYTYTYIYIYIWCSVASPHPPGDGHGLSTVWGCRLFLPCYPLPCGLWWWFVVVGCMYT